MTKPTHTDRLRGVLLGLAAGDRNGGPVRMAVRLAESLADLGRFDPDDVLSRYVDWWREGAFDTGPVAAGVLAEVASGVPREVAVRRVHESSGGNTAGCNPAHRCPPLALAGFIPDDDLPGVCAGEAGLTHFDPLAGDVAAAVAVLCRSLVRGDDWNAAKGKAATDRFRATSEAIKGCGSGSPGRGGYAPEVLRAAVHFVDRFDNFPDALTASLGFAGPANYCPVLVGAVGGARWGASGIPPEAVTHCDILSRVSDAADRLASGWTGTSFGGIR